MTSKKGLSVFAVAFMTVSTIMGAGFASGREIWQFFGVFGSDGYKGAILSGSIFIFVTYMTVTITKYINTNDIKFAHGPSVSTTGPIDIPITFSSLGSWKCLFILTKETDTLEKVVKELNLINENVSNKIL